MWFGAEWFLSVKLVSAGDLAPIEVIVVTDLPSDVSVWYDHGSQ